MVQTVKNNLIFDIGMHKGDDAEFYLRKGFNVISVEAYQPYCEAVTTKLRPFVDDGRLVIVNAAISETSGRTSFFVNKHKDDAHTAAKHVASWQPENWDAIEVETVRMADLFDLYGIPYYLKSDIEEGDEAVLRGLLGRDEIPSYVSVEAHHIRYLGLLYTAGYRRFKLINQIKHGHIKMPNPPKEGEYHTVPFTGHHSGPFGEESSGQWRDMEEVAYDHLIYKYGFKNKEQMQTGWYDYHATV